jgi:hypothetical protein
METSGMTEEAFRNLAAAIAVPAVEVVPENMVMLAIGMAEPAATVSPTASPATLSGTPAEARVHMELKQMADGKSTNRQETAWAERAAAEMQAALVPTVSVAAEAATRKAEAALSSFATKPGLPVFKYSSDDA